MKRLGSYGLTIIETLVVLGILAIAAALTMPLISHYINTNRLKSATEILYQDLSFAQSEAMKRGANVTVIFSNLADGAWCYGVTTANTCNCVNANSCNLRQVSSEAHAKNVTLSLTGITTTTVFDGSRGEVSTTGTITFTNSIGSMSIILNKMGAPRICTDTFGEYPSCS